MDWFHPLFLIITPYSLLLLFSWVDGRVDGEFDSRGREFNDWVSTCRMCGGRLRTTRGYEA